MVETLLVLQQSQESEAHIRNPVGCSSCSLVQERELLHHHRWNFSTVSAEARRANERKLGLYS